MRKGKWLERTHARSPRFATQRDPSAETVHQRGQPVHVVALAPIEPRTAKGDRLWVWEKSYFGTQGFANALQVVTIILATYSFIVYFIPEQALKRLQDKLDNAEGSLDVAKRKIEAVNSDLQLAERRKAVVERSNALKDDELKQKELALEEKTTALARAMDSLVQVEKSRVSAVAGAKKADEDAQASKKELAAVKHELQMAAVKKVHLEKELLATRSNLVFARQEVRRYVVAVFPRYLGTVCNISVGRDFSECAVQRLRVGEFSGLFSKKEMDSITAELRLQGKEIGVAWDLHFKNATEAMKSIRDACNAHPLGQERNKCEFDSVERARRYGEGQIGHYAAQAWLAAKLEPWANRLAHKSACPPLVKGAELPPDWPEDCL